MKPATHILMGLIGAEAVLSLTCDGYNPKQTLMISIGSYFYGGTVFDCATIMITVVIGALIGSLLSNSSSRHLFSRRSLRLRSD
jgi:hypothetical protein